MFLFPKIEKITRDATITNFFLHFGYKTFSLYFPLFLLARGFSLPEIGYTYLFIYLPIALFAPVVGFLNHKINPAVLASLGIAGYGVYALGMIFIENQSLFFLFQLLLGASAAMFFVSVRAILMASSLENANRAFGWFYSAPFYVDAVAPAVGAFFIWQFGFVGVFVFSLILHFFTAGFCFTRLKKPAGLMLDPKFKLQDFKENQQKTFSVLKERAVFPFLLVSFSVLFLLGFYKAYFVLFLKDGLLWQQNFILVFISVFSLLFLPVSIFAIRRLGRLSSERNILGGGLVVGLFSVLFGLAIPILNFLSVLIINLARSFGSLICGAGRSGLVNRKLKEVPEEAGAIDTVFAPLGVALGALASGLLIGFLGYQALFVLGGVLIVAVSLLAIKFAKT